MDEGLSVGEEGHIEGEVDDGEVGLVFEVEGRGNSSSGCRERAPPFVDELLIFDVVDDGLSVAEEGHTDGEVDEGEEGISGVCSTAVLTRN